MRRALHLTHLFVWLSCPRPLVTSRHLEGSLLGVRKHNLHSYIPWYWKSALLWQCVTLSLDDLPFSSSSSPCFLCSSNFLLENKHRLYCVRIVVNIQGLHGHANSLSPDLQMDSYPFALLNNATLIRGSLKHGGDAIPSTGTPLFLLITTHLFFDIQVQGACCFCIPLPRVVTFNN